MVTIKLIVALYISNDDLDISRGLPHTMVLIAGYVHSHAAIFKRYDRIFTINVNDDDDWRKWRKMYSDKIFF